MRNRLSPILQTLLSCLCIATPLPGRAAGDREPDRKIAQAAAVLGTNAVVNNIADERAYILLQLASRVDPKNKVVNHTLNLLGREMTPDPIRSRLSGKQLLQMMLSRAGQLYMQKRHLPLAALYCQTVWKLDHGNRQAALGLMKLKNEHNIRYKYTQLMADVELYDAPEKEAKEAPLVKQGKKKTDSMIDPKQQRGWSACVLDGYRWRQKPLNAFTAEDTNQGMIVKNTMDDGRFALLAYNRIYNGDFKVQIELKGGKEVVLQANDGADRQYAVKVVAQRSFHTYRFERKDGDVRFWLDGKESMVKRPKDLEDKPLVLGITLWRNQECEFKNPR